jgi:hypothetical protein
MSYNMKKEFYLIGFRKHINISLGMGMNLAASKNNDMALHRHWFSITGHQTPNRLTAKKKLVFG